MGYRIAVGTVGSGLWVSYDAGGKFRHIPRGPEVEGNCRALAVSPPARRAAGGGGGSPPGPAVASTLGPSQK